MTNGSKLILSASLSALLLSCAHGATQDAPRAQTESMSRYSGSLISADRQDSLYAAEKKGAKDKERNPANDAAVAQGTSLVKCQDGMDCDTAANATAIISFGVAEDTPDRVDTVTGASVLVKNDRRYSDSEYLGEHIAKITGAPHTVIISSPAFPTEHGALIDESIRTHEDLSVATDPAVDLERVKNIILIYPLWWHKPPEPVQRFLQKQDLSGKRIFPVCVHGNNVPFKMFSQLRESEPNAEIKPGLSVFRKHLDDAGLYVKIDRWLKKHGLVEGSEAKREAGSLSKEGASQMTRSAVKVQGADATGRDSASAEASGEGR